MKTLTQSEARRLYYLTAGRRSPRSLRQDVQRSRQRTRTLRRRDSRSWRYGSPNGWKNWDYRGVDDGSPEALRALRRFKSQRPRFDTLLSRGQQAEVWVDKRRGLVQKEFFTRPRQSVKEQTKFLLDNEDSGVVPIFFNADPEQGVLQMEYLDEYEELADALPLLKAGPDRQLALNALLRSLAWARRQLRLDKQYADLSNLRNILIRPDNDAPYGYSIKFVEGGKESTFRGDADTNVQRWMQQVADKLRLGRDPLVRRGLF